jgi:hypothetical protein
MVSVKAPPAGVAGGGHGCPPQGVGLAPAQRGLGEMCLVLK